MFSVIKAKAITGRHTTITNLLTLVSFEVMAKNFMAKVIIGENLAMLAPFRSVAKIIVIVHIVMHTLATSKVSALLVKGINIGHYILKVIPSAINNAAIDRADNKGR